jgi:hypothetical protein
MGSEKEEILVATLVERLRENANWLDGPVVADEFGALLREAADELQRVADLEVNTTDPDDARFLFLNCRCTAPLALPLNSIEHGLLAGWKCDSCGQTLMLSDIARASEALARDPLLPAVTRDPFVQQRLAEKQS